MTHLLIVCAVLFAVYRFLKWASRELAYTHRRRRRRLRAPVDYDYLQIRRVAAQHLAPFDPEADAPRPALALLAREPTAS